MHKKIFSCYYLLLILLIILSALPIAEAIENYGIGFYNFGVYGVAECGNNFCESNESCSSCSQDCGSCPGGGGGGGGGSSSGSGSGGGGGGGGGGGFFNLSQPATTEKNSSLDYGWTCTEWTECSPEGLQTRTCKNLLAGIGAFGKPRESRDCTYLPLLPYKELNLSKYVKQTEKPLVQKTGLSAITGKAIELIKNPETSAGIFILILILIIRFAFFRKKSRKKK